jgi:uncharacterized protein (DUF1697 family)
VTVYAALLKGINVGSSHRIRMEDLRKVFESMGLSRIKTYIQSGNVIFESDEKETYLRKKIELGMETAFGFAAVVVLRTADELDEIIQKCPFSQEEISEAEESNSEGESLYVALLPEEPEKGSVEKIEELRTGNDDVRFKGRDAYILLRHSIRSSKLAAGLQKLEGTSTVRNWKTLKNLCKLMKERR